MNLRALLSLAALAVSGLATLPAAASSAVTCKPGAPGFLSCWDGKLQLSSAAVWANVPGASFGAAPKDHDVFVAFNRACTLSSSGSLDCWGDNNYGELGDGTHVRRDKPVHVLDDVSSVALGPHLSCALRRSGNVACWGYDDISEHVRPTAVPSLDSVVEIVTGGGHACARRQDSSVWCWGGNHYGQLGDRTLKPRRRPVRVNGISDVVELAAGSSHTCARPKDGSVWCWGNGWGGEDGVDDDLLVPARVGAIRGATALVSTGSALLALQKDGRLVSCHYYVEQTESESSAKLRCRSETVPSAGAFDVNGTQTPYIVLSH
ncbi:BNR repeat domain protein [Minicystis rosea]|nr:BNR repeat domain protein [Minicystis rosea]